MSLAVTDLQAGYGKAVILRGVSLRLARGEVVALIGANGAGKSTLVKAISGLIPIKQGDVRDDDGSVLSRSAAQRARRGIVHVPEGRRLFPDFTVAENIRMGAMAARGRAGTSAVDIVLDSFPVLRERWRQTAVTLSGGEQQMVALVRAVAGKPAFLLLDEPSLGLSPRMAREVFRLIEIVRSELSVGVLVVEQRAELALRACERAYVLDRGEIVLDGTATEVSADPSVVAAYLGGPGPDHGRSDTQPRNGSSCI